MSFPQVIHTKPGLADPARRPGAGRQAAEEDRKPKKDRSGPFHSRASHELSLRRVFYIREGTNTTTAMSVKSRIQNIWILSAQLDGGRKT